MQTLSDYLAGVAKLNEKITFHQRWADLYLEEFNRCRKYEGFQLYYEQYFSSYDCTLIQQSDTDYLSEKIREMLQHLTQWHVCERNRAEADLEDFVRARYLENSH